MYKTNTIHFKLLIENFKIFMREFLYNMYFYFLSCLNWFESIQVYNGSEGAEARNEMNEGVS